MQLRRRNILSIYNGPEGLARGKGRNTVSRAGARRLGQLSSPDVLAPVRHLRTPSLVRHLRMPIILTLGLRLDSETLPYHPETLLIGRWLSLGVLGSVVSLRHSLIGIPSNCQGMTLLLSGFLGYNRVMMMMMTH